MIDDAALEVLWGGFIRLSWNLCMETLVMQNLGGATVPPEILPDFWGFCMTFAKLRGSSHILFCYTVVDIQERLW